MPATTVKLPLELKERVSALIKESGQSMHAYLLDAIERQTELAERRRSFLNEALAARKQMLRSGKGYAAHEVHLYMESLAQGKKTSRPRAKAWRR
jgi:predicted DNA-binding protein